MTRLPIILLCMFVAGGTASAATVSGSSALALASLVAANSRLLAQQDRSVLARMFAGYLNFRFPPDRKIARLSTVALLGGGMVCGVFSTITLPSTLEFTALIGIFALPVTALIMLLAILRRLTARALFIAFLLIVFFLVVLVWVWLWRMTGVPPAFLLAATSARVGLILVAWSYAPVHRG